MPLPDVQMKPSATRPARRAAAGPDAAIQSLDRSLGPIVDLRVVGLVELALERHELLGPELAR